MGDKPDAPLIDAAGMVQMFKQDKRLPQSLASARETLRMIIERDSWKAYYWPNDLGPDVVSWNTFEEFVTGRANDGGLAWTLEELRDYVRGDPAAEDAVDRVTRRPVGTNQHGEPDNNVTSLSKPKGNSARQALRTLRDKRPDLHQKVLGGELSPHAAMVKAGFRKKTWTAPADVEGLATALRKRFKGKELKKLLALL